MHKYAAVTSLAITLTITMLTPAVSASTHYCRPGSLACHCAMKCDTELWNAAKLWDRNSFIQNKPLRDACRATCMAGKTATQH
jgi:hypothetical protein